MKDLQPRVELMETAIRMLELRLPLIADRVELLESKLARLTVRLIDFESQTATNFAAVEIGRTDVLLVFEELKKQVSSYHKTNTFFLSRIEAHVSRLSAIGSQMSSLMANQKSHSH